MEDTPIDLHKVYPDHPLDFESLRDHIILDYESKQNKPTEPRFINLWMDKQNKNK